MLSPRNFCHIEQLVLILEFAKKLVIIDVRFHVAHSNIIEQLVVRFLEFFDKIQGKSTIVVFLVTNMEATVVACLAFDL